MAWVLKIVLLKGVHEATKTDVKLLGVEQWDSKDEYLLVHLGDSVVVSATILDDLLLNTANCTSCWRNASTTNSTTNDTDAALSNDDAPTTSTIVIICLSTILGLMILVTVIGNVFVITAIFIDRNLQNVANYLIVSLAVADLMVACLVMPLGAVYVISNNWIMGPEVCDMWTSIDVLCSSASILHLVAIALDRFWAVTNVDYMHTRNRRRIIIMIAVVWVIALIVSLSPQIPQFKDPDYIYRIEVKKQCLVSQDVKYQVFATFSTFYLPLLIIFILYWKIFQTARKRIRKRRDLKSGDLHVDASTVRSSNSSKSSDSFVARRYIKLKCSKKPSAEVLTTSLLLVEGQAIVGADDPDGTHGSDIASEEETTTFTTNKREPDVDSTTQSCNASPKRLLPTQSNGSVSRHSTAHKETPTHILRKEKKESIEAKRERKAAKTLAIITGAFVMCWLPFFILALLLPLCGDACNISGYVMSFALWLGYFNSTLNPVIYTVFSPEFRQAFKRILFGPQRQRGSYRSGRMK